MKQRTDTSRRKASPRAAPLATAAFLLTLVAPAIAQDATAPDPDRAEKLRRQRQAAVERLREPLLLEARSFSLYVDRHDPTLRLEDRTTRINWNGPLDRRGFASILLAAEDEGERELPIDRMENVEVRGTSIRFEGRSSQGEIPRVHFALSVTSPLVGLEITVELDREAAERGARVKLLDRALWISDLDGGGALLPIGLGEWHGIEEPREIRRRLTARAASNRPTTTLRGLGLRRGESGLLVVWDGPGVELDVARRQLAGDPHGREWILETSVTVSPSRSASRGESRGDSPGAGSIRLYPLGRIERSQLATSYGQILGHPRPVPSLRLKTASEERLRTLIGGAFFRFSLPGSAPDRATTDPRGVPLDTFAAVQSTAARLRKRLEIDRAMVILDSWHEPIAAEGPWELVALSAAGGDDGLSECARSLHDLGYVLALEAPLRQAISRPDADSRQLRKELVEIDDIFSPDALFITDTVTGRRAPRSATGRGELQRLEDSIDELLDGVIPLAGAPYFDELQAHGMSYLEGVIDPQSASPDAFYPFLPAVLGHNARLAAPPERPLRADRPDEFFLHLLLGEAPLYGDVAATPKGDTQTTQKTQKSRGLSSEGAPFTRGDGGWYEGTDFSAAERFLKTTYEVLGPTAALRARNTLHSYKKLTADGSVEEIYYGFDLRIVINRGDEPYSDEEGRFVLPKHGFWVQHPFFLAFHALQAFELSYDTPALFTLRSLEGKLWLRAESVRIWHAFGPSKIRLGGRVFDVEKEHVGKLW